MCQFDKGIFTPAANGEGEFAEVRHKAFEGSDYQEELYREGAAVRHHMEAVAAVPDQRVTEAAAGAAVRHHVEAEATAEAVGVDLDENRILR
jgi:hypothetical protein